jgi:tetratricopeptide (TPR) repeat protein
VPKQPSRPVPNKDDLDLTPPEEIRARKIRLFVFLGLIAACVLGVAIYFAARPVGGAIKGWQSRRQARQAFILIDQKKWTEANAKARDAYMLRPTEPESWRAIARLGSRTSQWAAALQWWKKVDEAHRLTVEDRRDFVGAALTLGEVTVAAKQVEALLAQRAGPAPIDIVFAGQVAGRQNDPVLAVDYAERALADKRSKPYEILSAATLILSVTSPYSQPYASAWKQIEAVARDPKNPGSLDALTLLAREEAIPPMPAIAGNTSLSLESRPTPRPTLATQEAASAGATAARAAVSPGAAVAAGEGATPAPSPTPATEGAAYAEAASLPAAAAAKEGSPPDVSLGSSSQSGDTVTLNLAAPSAPVAAGRTMTLKEVADALENHPDARPSHKLLALEVRARQDPALTDQYVADAVQRFGNAADQAQLYQGTAELADETLVTLAGWLNKIGRPAKTLEVLPQARASQRQDLFLQYLNALAALQRWNEIKDLVFSERFPIEPMLQHMYLAVAQKHLGSETGATNEWQRALEVAKTPEKLSALAKYAEQNSVNDIADAAYSEAIKIVPKNRAAYDGRLRLALAAGKTADAQTIAAEITQLWPDDAAARNQDAYLRLLLGASDGAAEATEREAEVLVRKEPRNWLARATLGLARLRLGRNKEALASIRDLRVTGIEPPGAMAVRAAILAANGYEDGARNDARILAAKPLLPEERALIAPLLP